jgi:RNA polymerase sigma-70 factor (ECF subfamily)
MDFFLVRESHKNADRARGRFRNYLFTAARHALLDWKKFGGSLRRGGGTKKISLDALKGGMAHVEPTGKLSPEQEYDRQWAISTWQVALELFKSRHDASLVEALELFYFSPERYTQQEAAAKLGISAAAFNSRLYTARRHLFACLKEIVLPTVESEPEMKEELEHLRTLLSEYGLC